MRNLEAILWPIALISVAISFPATLVVWRTVIPWRRRLKDDGSRTDDRTLDITVGPIHVVDKPKP